MTLPKGILTSADIEYAKQVHEKLLDKCGLFIAFEGGEGSGKSTQARLLAERLTNLGFTVTLTHEPGGSPACAQIRKILLDQDTEPLFRKTELLLFLADRAQHVHSVIGPALLRGEIVISDRYEASTLAYQAYAGGMELGRARDMSEWASDNMKPDVTFYLDVPVEVGLARKTEDRNRFEEKELGFHLKVREGYRAQRNKTWYVKDAQQDISTLQRRIYWDVVNVIESFLNPEPAKPTVTPETLVLCPKCNTQMEPEMPWAYAYTCPDGHGRLVFQKN